MAATLIYGFYEKRDRVIQSRIHIYDNDKLCWRDTPIPKAYTYRIKYNNSIYDDAYCYGIPCDIDGKTGQVSIKSESDKKLLDEFYDSLKNKDDYSVIGYYNCMDNLNIDLIQLYELGGNIYTPEFKTD